MNPTGMAARKLAKKKVDEAQRAALTLGRALLAEPDMALVAIDPGTSTGWCVGWREADGIQLHHAQEAGVVDATDNIMALLGVRPIGLLCIEKPFGAVAGRIARVDGPWRAGEARGRLAYYQADEAALWTPLPGQWRSWLGLAGGKRAVVNGAVHEWAQAKVRHPLRSGEALEYDRANAIGLFSAALAAMFTVTGHHALEGEGGDEQQHV